MTLVLLHDDQPAVAIPRVPEGQARYEDELRDLLFANPEMLPVRELEPGIGALVPIAKELTIIPECRLDCLLVDIFGRLIIVECKLWSNPEARRKVVGQILDYARALSRFSYEDLQRIVSANLGQSGNMLFEKAKAAGSTLSEAAFVDRVTRDLAAGRFLLMIVGDGIKENTQQIVEYLQEQPGLAFTFSLIEMAEYRFHDPLVGQTRTIIHPRLLVRTINLERIVIRSEVPNTVIAYEPPAAAPSASRVGGGSSELAQQWRDFAARLIAALGFDDPGQPPARNGGLGWLRVPLPGPAHLTLWRSVPQQEAGAFIKFAGADGMAAYELLLGEREAIDTEFGNSGLTAPTWNSKAGEGTIELTWATTLPWTDDAENAQIASLATVANQFVNSLRPRLLAMHLG